MNNIDPEKELIRGFLAGESKTYTTINSWINTILNARSWHHSITTAKDDIRQEVLVALTENFRKGQYKGLGLKAYVSSMTRFICLKAYDKHTAVDIEKTELISGNPSALENMVNSEKYDIIKTSFWKLNHKCQKLLALKFYRELDHNRIAKILKITVVTSRQWLKRCLDKLREEVFRENSP
jgi:RNA polymerase sigma factor (sigma-70 family)